MHLNIYNLPTLQWLASLGATRWVAPLEMKHEDLTALIQNGPQALQTEVFAYGRMPLAFSARCFTARHHRLSKDQCEFRCRDDADGLLLSTSDGAPFLVLNGIQTQSAAQQCLIAEREALIGAGVERIRLSPASQRFGSVIECFEGVMNGGESVDAALSTLDSLSPPGGLADGFAHGRPGLEWSHA